MRVKVVVGVGVSERVGVNVEVRVGGRVGSSGVAERAIAVD